MSSFQGFEERRLDGDSAGELRVLEFVPDGGGDAALVLLPDVFGPDAACERLARTLAAEGVRCAVLDTALLAEGERALEFGASLEERAAHAAGFEDRRLLRAVEQVLAEQEARIDGRRRTGVLGVGQGGELALLAGCTSRRVSFVVSVQGPLVRASLDEKRPNQPLELTLNLDAPLLLVAGTEDPRTPAEHVDLLRAKLDAFFRSYEVEWLDGAGPDCLRPDAPGYNAELSERVLDVVKPFVREALD